MTYTTFMQDEIQIGGVFQMPVDMAGVPSHWGLYFKVSSFADTFEAAQAAGAKPVMESKIVAGVGQFVSMVDPQGAMFSILQYEG